MIQDLYQKAIRFAGEAHKNQKLPNSEISYIVHLANVTNEVIYALQTDTSLNAEFAVQVALLHDCIEDTIVTFEDIENEFSKEVAKAVFALTKNETLEKEIQLEDSVDRILNEPKEIWIVKMADRITNLQKPPDNWTNEKKKNYQNEAQMIYDKLHTANEYIAERFLRKINDYSKYF
ncbi:MAG: guanosine polyphosphate pyrophosphohydrolase [Bacteroidetes bacterium GWA2_31_9]|nr:MAG: guanosine polyphosphate pyrophosphohydrolase [Bacteroidetes bacterium GWA2_31_9]